MSAEKKLEVRWKQHATPFEVAMWKAICGGVSLKVRKDREALEKKRLAYLEKV